MKLHDTFSFNSISVDRNSQIALNNGQWQLKYFIDPDPADCLHQPFERYFMVYFGMQEPISMNYFFYQLHEM